MACQYLFNFNLLSQGSTLDFMKIIISSGLNENIECMHNRSNFIGCRFVSLTLQKENENTKIMYENDYDSKWHLVTHIPPVTATRTDLL